MRPLLLLLAASVFAQDQRPAPQVDLRPEIQKLEIAIRSQGERGVCSIFATTFLIEYHTARLTGEKGIHLSVEYLHWAKDQVAPVDRDFFTDILAGYKAFGIVPEKEMPYQATFDVKNPWTPAKEVVETGKATERFRFRYLKKWDNQMGYSEEELKAVLATMRRGHPVATGMWWPGKLETVKVEEVPLVKEYPRKDNEHKDASKNPMFDGHTIALVGFREDEAFPGGGYCVFRNSFGPKWGDEGYGYLSFQYLRDYANDAIAIEAKEPVK